jgi:hypothetical protein
MNSDTEYGAELENKQPSHFVYCWIKIVGDSNWWLAACPWQIPDFAHYCCPKCSSARLVPSACRLWSCSSAHKVSTKTQRITRLNQDALEVWRSTSGGRGIRGGPHVHTAHVRFDLNAFFFGLGTHALVASYYFVRNNGCDCHQR